MGIINSIFLVCISAVLLWLLYSSIKHRPELFSAQNLNKSFFTMGILSIFLIAIVGFAIFLVR